MRNILDYLERTVKRYPGKEAVDDGGVCYTWEELYRLSQRIGTAVAETGGMIHRPVPVFMEKRADTVAAFFGIAYAGCFYILINPEYPEERIRKMLMVLEADVAVSEAALNEKLRRSGFTGNIIDMEAAKLGQVQEDLLGRIRQQVGGTDYLYGIFTSGSMGTPRNVVVSHQAVIDFIEDFTDTFSFRAEDVLGNQAPFDFDVSVKDIYTAAVTGAKLVLISRSMFATLPQLLDYICEKKVTVIIWAVSAICMITSLRGFEYRIPRDIRYVFFSGEVMPRSHLDQWIKVLREAEFVNLYGPTEVTCNCSYYRVKGNESERNGLPIGGAFPKREVFLLDSENKRVVRPGIYGEICVGGETLSSGYYNDKTATDEKFVINPFGRNSEEKIYHTGDIGYWDCWNELHFAGRKDHQIKHMGYRIELEEVEWEIGRIPGINRVCCIYNHVERQLAAFYMGTLRETEIRERIKRQLPAYMVPSRFVRLLMMPLNKNGKMDRKYLWNCYMRGEKNDKR